MAIDDSKVCGCGHPLTQHRMTNSPPPYHLQCGVCDCGHAATMEPPCMNCGHAKSRHHLIPMEVPAKWPCDDCGCGNYLARASVSTDGTQLANLQRLIDRESQR